jgi:hypothetical protein
MALKKLSQAITAGRVPYNYIVGSKGTSKGLPFDVRLSIDKEFNKAVTKWVTIGAGGVALGIIAGFVLTKKRS